MGSGEVSFSGTDDRRSPIDIITNNPLNEDVNPLTLKRWDRKLRGEYVNTGHSVKFTPSDEGPTATVTKGGQKYKVCHFHIHWGANAYEGSEHLIDGQAYAGELHIVSVKDTLSCGASFKNRDDLLVIGVFFKVVNTPIAKTVWRELYPVPRRYHQTKQVTVQLNRFLPYNRAYYFYEGSLTTEPYNKCVQWHVLKYPIKIPKHYLNQLRSTLNEEGEPVRHNFRNIQPLNGRKILMCRRDRKKCIKSP